MVDRKSFVILKRGAFFALLFLLFSSCQRAPASDWRSSTSKPSSDHFFHCRLVRSSKMENSGIELECVASTKERRFYFNLHSIPWEEKKPIATVIVDTKAYSFPLIAHSGGQRFQLYPKEAQQLIDWIEQGKEIEIFLDRYYERIRAKETFGTHEFCHLLNQNTDQ